MCYLLFIFSSVLPVANHPKASHRPSTKEPHKKRAKTMKIENM